MTIVDTLAVSNTTGQPDEYHLQLKEAVKLMRKSQTPIISINMSKMFIAKFKAFPSLSDKGLWPPNITVFSFLFWQFTNLLAFYE